jgi:hypothetical protein
MQVLTSEEPVAADDVFSLSCLLYRLIAGYRVFGPRNAAEASQEGMKPQRLTGLNDNQWKALKKGLAYSRVARFSSVREFVDALDADKDEPFRIEAPDRFADIDDEPGVSKWLIALLLIACLAAAGGYQYGYLDPLLDKIAGQEIQSPVIIEAPVAIIQTPKVVDPVVTSEPELELSGDTEADAVEEVAATVDEEVTAAEIINEPIVEEGPVIGPDSMLVDFSTLPPATEIIPFSPGGGSSKAVNIAIREDGPDVIIDFVRGSNLATPMNLRLEEVGFSGNRSPWAAGQYALSNSGLIHFPAGQARGRVTLTMASDPLREVDQQSTLRLREADFPDSELAIVNLTLEDDDQRKFEARLSTNTIAFSTGQVSIRETDPAVQIDLVRFNPDNLPLVIEYTVSDITATEGEDYFAPGGHSITFGPGQRSARLLVPLVQDAVVEGDETFVVELVSGRFSRATDVNRQVIVTIRDDEPQTR